MGLLGATRDQKVFLALVIAFVVAISIHEACHALAATRLGDPTPRLQGRLTLNPLRHLDPIGTLLLVVAGFGWGRPVMINPLNLKYGVRRGMAVVSAAGPASNLAMAGVLGPLVRQIAGDEQGLLFGGEFLTVLLLLTIQINIVLAVFNLIPIPPLDGFCVLYGIVGPETAMRLDPLRRYGPLILIGVVFLGPMVWLNLFYSVLLPPVEFLHNLIVGG